MQEIKKRRGPEPIPAEQKRGKRISVYLTGAEYAELLSRVKSKDDLAPYIRAQAFAGKTPVAVEVPAINLRVYAELARVASNLNQISRKLNAADIVDVSQLQTELHAFRLALISQGGQE